MQFRSTESNLSRVSFKDAVLRCLPPDGGLYVPTEIMDLRQFLLGMDEETSYPELVAATAPALLQGDLNPLSAAKLAESAFDFEPEIKQLDDNLSVLNLYNGPSGTFKDFGVAFLAALMEEFLKDRNPRRHLPAMILSAARGDNGVNLGQAFHGRRGLRSVILYPTGPIRGLDPGSFVPNGGSIIPIQIKGTLDDCYRLINETINDRPFAERYNITSANAINPGRLLPQALYYIYAFIKVKKRLSGDLFFSVPCGNFGNLISGLYAWKFGLPTGGFIAAMNANNAFGDFIRGGKFKPRRAIATNSPALDVSFPSNYRRFCSFYEESPAVMRNMVFPSATGDTETVVAMEQAWKQYGILLDPHSAVAFSAARNFIKANFPGGYCGGSHVIILATGHPARESSLVITATGQTIPLPEKLTRLKKEVNPIALIDPHLEALEGAIASSC